MDGIVAVVVVGNIDDTGSDRGVSEWVFGIERHH